MNYIGSKNKLSDFIISSIEKTVGTFKNAVFADIFAGTGIISRRLKGKVKKIISNDIEYYSYVMNRNYIGNCKSINHIPLLEKLNNLNGKQGFIFKEYCPSGNKNRNYFTDFNGKKIDAIRKEIELYLKKAIITEDEYYFLLTSLLESTDKIANTASVYGAFLKHFKKSALRPLIVEPALFDTDKNIHEIYSKDANQLVSEISGDILYIDPPYNARQYGANYHLLNTIAQYKKFNPKGKTGLPEYQRSLYCSKRYAEDTLKNLIKSSDFNYIFLSYNNEGIIPAHRIKEIFRLYGKYDLAEFSGYHRFKADRPENRQFKFSKTTEFLHILEK